MNVVHLVGGEENSGAFKGASLLNNDLKCLTLVSIAIPLNSINALCIRSMSFSKVKNL